MPIDLGLIDRCSLARKNLFSHTGEHLKNREKMDGGGNLHLTPFNFTESSNYTSIQPPNSYTQFSPKQKMRLIIPIENLSLKRLNRKHRSQPSDRPFRNLPFKKSKSPHRQTLIFLCDQHGKSGKIFLLTFPHRNVFSACSELSRK